MSFFEQSAWFWAGMVAVAVIIAISGLAAFVGGNGRIYEDIQIAAALVCVGSIFRWAILRERVSKK
jgi:hypothetical protein